MIDEMARSGVPPVNPYIEHDGGIRVTSSYYYLLHFSGAELVVLFGVERMGSRHRDDLLRGVHVAGRDDGRSRCASAVGPVACAGGSSVFALSDSMRLLVDRRLRQRDRSIAGYILPADSRAGCSRPRGCRSISPSTTCVLLVADADDAARARDPRSCRRLGTRPRHRPAGFESSTWVGGVDVRRLRCRSSRRCWCGAPPRRRRTHALHRHACRWLPWWHWLFAWPFIVATRLARVVGASVRASRSRCRPQRRDRRCDGRDPPHRSLDPPSPSGW